MGAQPTHRQWTSKKTGSANEHLNSHSNNLLLQMAGAAGADLAVAVSKAGGLGQIGSGNDMKDLQGQLSSATGKLERQNGLLPIGVGFLLFLAKQEEALPVLQESKPAIVWLYGAADFSDYGSWTREVRRVLPSSQIWIQVGSVQAALTIADDARPDVMCIQGSDAGGHGFEKSAGIISLLPEVADALTAAGHGKIPLVAAGGIVDSRAATAALALGAQGVVIGTRFLSASEARVHPKYREMILTASDGGQMTVRSKLFDEVYGPNKWPAVYDGRSFRNVSFKDYEEGVGIEQIRSSHAEAIKDQNKGFAEFGKGRATAWAGTGVGLIKKEQPAAEIVEELRNGIGKVLDRVKTRL